MSHTIKHIPFKGLPISTENTFWGTLTANLLVQLGLRLAVISPGSRSTPLTFAFATHPELEAIPVLDERSAAFFALGKARESGLPVALICTSGTAAANYFPAIIEARYSHIPLLVLTADRPHELRGCHSGQTIDQVRLYGDYPVFQAEAAYPDNTEAVVRAHIDLLKKAWEAARCHEAGPVHLNMPFRDPLVPAGDGAQIPLGFDPDSLIAACKFPPRKNNPLMQLPIDPGGRGLILAGPSNPVDAEGYCRGVAALSRALGWPVFAEALSPLRNHASINPYLISGYDTLLQNPVIAREWVPERVLQLGSLPTSKRLRAWLEEGSPRTLVLDPSADRRDPLQRPTQYCSARVEDCLDLPEGNDPDVEWLEQWIGAEQKFRMGLEAVMAGEPELFEGKIPHFLAHGAPAGSAIFIANSMPVRDAEYFWPLNDDRHAIFSNRGANGIDGTLSTALGMAHRANRPCILLTGDLALLHDANGALVRSRFMGNLTVLLINNGGGAIFENLSISAFRTPFTDYFLTPQGVDFQSWARALEMEHRLIADWSALGAALGECAFTKGIRILEVRTQPSRDIPRRQQLTRELAESMFSD